MEVTTLQEVYKTCEHVKDLEDLALNLDADLLDTNLPLFLNLKGDKSFQDEGNLYPESAKRADSDTVSGHAQPLHMRDWRQERIDRIQRKKQEKKKKKEREELKRVLNWEKKKKK